jgi:hypothetical protein
MPDRLAIDQTAIAIAIIVTITQTVGGHAAALTRW